MFKDDDLFEFHFIFRIDFYEIRSLVRKKEVSEHFINSYLLTVAYFYSKYLYFDKKFKPQHKIKTYNQRLLLLLSMIIWLLLKTKKTTLQTY